jgi:RsiW-degrading membrane proteinase PrsW (M82 family)
MPIADPKILGLALLGGIVPSFAWLWFWLKEDRKNPEPKGLISVVFLMGMIAVFCVIPIQKFIKINITSPEWQIFWWATAEEVIKYIAVLAILYKTHYADEPIDWPIYMITGALGFAALENTFFLIKPLSLGQTTVSLLTGQLRFLGATLLHTITSGILGISLGMSMSMGWFQRKFYFIIGLILASSLHSIFNFFIMRNNGDDFLKVFGFLWVVTIVVMLLFEKIRRIN